MAIVFNTVSLFLDSWHRNKLHCVDLPNAAGVRRYLCITSCFVFVDQMIKVTINTSNYCKSAMLSLIFHSATHKSNIDWCVLCGQMTGAFSHTDTTTWSATTRVIKLKAKKQTPGGDKNQHNSRLMGEPGVDLSSLDRLMRVTKRRATIKVTFLWCAFNSTASPETRGAKVSGQ